MKWYSGDVGEAVALSKTKNAIFVVYIEGDDEMSRNLTKLIDTEQVSRKLESDDFVAIKINANSQAYGQFMSIYTVVPVPSIFFIGKSGTPLEIGTGVIANAEELERKIDKVLVAAGKKTSAASTSLLIQAEKDNAVATKRNVAGEESQEDDAAASKGESTTTNNESTTSPTAVALSSSPAAAVAAAPTSSPTAAAQLNATLATAVQQVAGATGLQATPLPVSAPVIDSEERLAQLQRTVEEKRQEEKNLQQQVEEANKRALEEERLRKLEEEAKKREQEEAKKREQEAAKKREQEEAKKREEEEKRKKLEEEAEAERKRREEALKAELARIEQAEVRHQQELKALQESIRRERQLEAEERERIRTQIAADRAERENARRMQQTLPTTTAAASSPAMANIFSNNSSNETLLQLRLPDGVNKNKIFSSELQLSAVRDYIVNELLTDQRIGRDFTLATTYPRHEFSLEDELKTLAELKLVPNAILLVLMREHANRVVREKGFMSILATVFWALLTPAAKAFDYVNQIGFRAFTERIGQRLTQMGWIRPTPEVETAQNELRHQRNLDMFMQRTNTPNTDAQPDNVNTNEGTAAAAAKATVNNPEPTVPPPTTSEVPRRNYSGEANIHRLRDSSKDEDDKATYNGNSTQQQ